jgi:lysophospholipase L1-like esterase
MRRAAEFALVLLLAGCAHAKPSAPARMTYLALGDSYTIGEGVAARDRWPVQLARMLGERGIAVADPMIIAKTGWTTDELAAAIPERLPATFSLVTLLIGVNNQYRGRDLEEYRTQFVSLLGRAVEFAAGDASRVVVLSIPDWGVTPFAKDREHARIAGEIDRFNAVNREETQRAGARYVDVTGISRRDPSDVVDDGLHPSPRAYAAWARAALPEAEAALRQKANP